MDLEPRRTGDGSGRRPLQATVGTLDGIWLRIDANAGPRQLRQSNPLRDIHRRDGRAIVQNSYHLRGITEDYQRQTLEEFEAGPSDNQELPSHVLDVRDFLTTITNDSSTVDERVEFDTPTEHLEDLGYL